VVSLDELDCLKDHEIVEIPIETEEESAENVESFVEFIVVLFLHEFDDLLDFVDRFKKSKQLSGVFHSI